MTRVDGVAPDAFHVVKTQAGGVEVAVRAGHSLDADEIDEFSIEEMKLKQIKPRRIAPVLLVSGLIAPVLAWSGSSGLTAVSRSVEKLCSESYDGRQALSANGSRVAWVQRCSVQTDPEDSATIKRLPDRVLIRDRLAAGTIDLGVYERGYASSDPSLAVLTDPATYQGETGAPGLSADGNWLVYVAERQVEVDGKTKLVPAVMLAQLRPTASMGGGATRAAVSIRQISGLGNDARNPHISSDGSYVVFVSGGDVYRYDRVANSVERIRPIGSPEWKGVVSNPSISDDGNWVAFSSNVRLAGDDDNDFSDIYLYNRKVGTLVLASRGPITPLLSAGDLPSYDPIITADGKRVFYTSLATNITAAKDSSEPVQSNVYMFDIEASTSYLVNGAETRMCRPSNVWTLSHMLGRLQGCGTMPGGGSSFQARPSADGRYVAFYSRSMTPVPESYRLARVAEIPSTEAADTMRIIVKDLLTGQNYVRSVHYQVSAEGWKLADRLCPNEPYSLNLSADGQVTGMAFGSGYGSNCANYDLSKDELVGPERVPGRSLYLGTGLGVAIPSAPRP